MIRLERVDERTFKKVIDMKLPAEQNGFVAPNVVSLAQAWLYYDEALPLAICSDGEPVGFLMMDMDEGERTAGIWRFMIAAEHQRKGYGRAAMEAAIELAKNAGKFDLMHLDYVEGNTAARALYHSLGFRENGDIEEGEIVMTLPLTDTPRVGILTADSEDTEEILSLIVAQREAGVPVPEQFSDDGRVSAAVENGRIQRLTLFGETVGVAMDGAMLMDADHAQYADEALERVQGFKGVK